MELPFELLFVLGLVASGVVWILRILFVNKGREVPAWVYSVALYVVSLVLALLFAPVELPPFPPYDDLPSGIAALLAFLGELIPVLSAFVGFATIVYQALLKRILEGLGESIRRAMAGGSDIG